MNKEQTFNDLFTEAGLHFEETGGGCTAWVRDFEDGSRLMVTGDGGCEVPDEDCMEIEVGLYTDDGVDLYYEEFGYVQTALNKVKEIIAGYPGNDFEL